MSNIVKMEEQAVKMEKVLLGGDLSKLTSAEKTAHYMSVCHSVNLNPLTKPFEYIKLNGKEVLYPTKNCSEQLRNNHKISIQIVAREKIGDVYVVTARATNAAGREDESTGAVALGKLQGEALANLYMKAETKAKRRVTLSICGLGMNDEEEIADIPEVQRERKAAEVAKLIEATPTPEPEEDFEEIPVAACGEYVIKVGRQFVGQKIQDVHPETLKKMVDYANQYEADRGEISDDWNEFRTNAKEFLQA